MTVLELHERLTIMMKASPRCRDYIVGVPDKSFGGMGGTPIKELKSINNGIDWNRGKAWLSIED